MLFDKRIVINNEEINTFFVLLVSFPVMTPSGPRFTVLSKSLMSLSTSATTVNKVVSGVMTTSSGRPVMRVPPLNVAASQPLSSGNNSQQSNQPQSIRGIVTRQTQKEVTKTQTKGQPKSEFYLVIKNINTKNLIFSDDKFDKFLFFCFA